MKRKQRTSKRKGLSATELDAIHDGRGDLSAHMDLGKAVRPGREVQPGNITVNGLVQVPVLTTLRGRQRPTRPPARTRERVLAKVPGDLRQQIDRWANEWLKTKFSRLLELRAADPGPFNYPVEVFSEWRGKAFCLCVRYRFGKGRPPGDFIVRQTRLTMTGFGRFELAYFRHTERWFTVHRWLTAAECFKEIEAHETFWPVM